MDREWFKRLLQAAALTLTLAAVCQELEKPREERTWHGKVARFVPYDFRVPTLDRIMETYWNPKKKQIFNPQVFGVGWAVNFHALLEKLGVTGQDVSEESFLMPTRSIKEVLEPIYTED